MVKYLHISVKGHPKGYYEEEKAWKIINTIPQTEVRFVAGPFSFDAVEELCQQTKARGGRPLPIYPNDEAK